jgi:hypothetical protein
VSAAGARPDERQLKWAFGTSTRKADLRTAYTMKLIPDTVRMCVYVCARVCVRVCARVCVCVCSRVCFGGQVQPSADRPPSLDAPSPSWYPVRMEHFWSGSLGRAVAQAPFGLT